MTDQQSTEFSPFTAAQDEILAVVEAVMVFEKNLIPAGINQTFFSINDVWVFLAVLDKRACWVCKLWDNTLIGGERLRGLFPNLEIVDIDTIKAHIHPFCRCKLRRYRWYVP